MRILLVDDHTLLREGLVLLFKRYDKSITVLQAGNLSEAEGILCTPGEPLDLILLDLELKDDNSPQTVLSRVIHLSPNIPLVVISGQTDPRLVLDAIESGAMAFIPKSLPFKELADALTRAIDGEVYLPSTAISAFPALQGAGRIDTAHALANLSLRQMEILRLAVLGLSNQGIGEKLGIMEGTVKSHMVQIYRTLKVGSRVEAVYLLAQTERRKAPR